LSKIAQHHAKDDLVILAVNAWDESKKTVAEFVKKNSLTQTILLDGNSLREQYRVKSIPMLFFIDREGIVQDVQCGFRGEASLHRKTQALLRGRG